MTISAKEMASRIDHALLRPDLTEAEVRAGLALAAKYDVASVCVRPADIPMSVRELSGSNVEVGTVIGFPHGGIEPTVKLYESRIAMDQGATEIDVVVNIGQVRSGLWHEVQTELDRILIAAHEREVLVKVIFENCYLNEAQKIKLADICAKLGADYVKTSTGFGTSGATLEDIALMKKTVDGKCKLKAAGGISDVQAAVAFVEAGCDRIGCSATAAILDALS